MKVLFAVNDENISTSIVKKYQKQYKEIISYKNVYYFNAILKELQRNKGYDRIVISEDLEEFTSSSYDQKDKFIFDRLDNISDEALDIKGRDIPIILICSERRTKSEDILVKLFGIGIYNAIIGDDRSTDEVCSLIYKPRSKKEAKVYYKIDSENVSYEHESDNEVSEMEMQNILAHFKKLGKNEDKYVESFRNIVSQYNDEQLKIIIAILPLNVKAVLEEKSTEYQRIIFAGRKPIRKKNDDSSTAVSKKNKNVQLGTSEKLLNVDGNKKRLTRPVVVPTTIEDNMFKKVEPKTKMTFEQNIMTEDEDFELNEVQQEKPKRRGRPRKNPVVEEQITTQEKTKKRGRPRKNPIAEPVEIDENQYENVDDDIDDTFTLPGFEQDDETIIKSNEKVNHIEQTTQNYDEEDDSFLPGFEEYNDDEDEFKTDSIYKEESKDGYYQKTNLDTQNTFLESKTIQDYNNSFNDEQFQSLLTGDNKIVSFVGTSKNGTSFIINNIAQILSSMGINTAIFDATQNKSAYYIYTKNDEQLRTIAVNSLNNLIQGNAKGIRVNNNLTVYTNIPNQNDQMKDTYPILETLIRNHSIVLIDCDFETPVEYFEKSQELYLVQSMDVLTIQPLTAFLRDLKTKNVLDERKIRIVLNKLLRVRGVGGKNIVGGMSNYNDPEMSFMTELFDRNTVKIVAQIPFDEDVYIKYLENIIECEMRVKGYPKEFKQKLNNLAETIYPLLPNKNSNNKRGKNVQQFNNSFSSSMNNTLNNMKKRY